MVQFKYESNMIDIFAGISAALAGADAAVAIRRRVSDILDQHRDAKIVLVGCGKAMSPMLTAALPVISNKLVAGSLVTKYGHITADALAAAAASTAPGGVLLMEAGHPSMDDQGMHAAAQIMECLDKYARGAVVIALLSGGGSALTPLPASHGAVSLSFHDFAVTNEALLGCGATIDEVNCVRKHLSAFSGGRLAQHAVQCGAVGLHTLAISDVIGDREDVIASGCTSVDPSTFLDALHVLTRYELTNKVPALVLALLHKGIAGEIPETLKHPISIPHSYFIVAGNRNALQACSEYCTSQGVQTQLLTSTMHGEAKHAAAFFAGVLQEALVSRVAAAKPTAILCGGETTVTLGTATGKGGRNQEFALAVALALEKIAAPSLLSSHEISIACVGTDGTDGPTDAAGALVTRHTLAVARQTGLDPQAALDNHDSYNFFKRLQELSVHETAPGIPTSSAQHPFPWSVPDTRAGGLIKTGATGSNVMDMVLALIH